MMRRIPRGVPGAGMGASIYRVGLGGIETGWSSRERAKRLQFHWPTTPVTSEYVSDIQNCGEQSPDTLVPAMRALHALDKPKSSQCFGKGRLAASSPNWRVEEGDGIPSTSLPASLSTTASYLEFRQEAFCMSQQAVTMQGPVAHSSSRQSSIPMAWLRRKNGFALSRKEKGNGTAAVRRPVFPP